jgi:hypothetical protein
MEPYQFVSAPNIHVWGRMSKANMERLFKMQELLPCTGNIKKSNHLHKWTTAVFPKLYLHTPFGILAFLL